jgi:hypothetical protein
MIIPVDKGVTGKEKVGSEPQENYSLLKVNISPIFASHLVFIPRAP